MVAAVVNGLEAQQKVEMATMAKTSKARASSKVLEEGEHKQEPQGRRQAETQPMQQWQQIH
jgi:hypothetical protein